MKAPSTTAQMSETTSWSRAGIRKCTARILQAAGRVDHLACDPPGVVRAEPADEARGVLWGAETAKRQTLRIAERGADVPAGVRRAGVDGVDSDPARDQLCRQRGGRLVERTLRDRVGDLPRHRAVVLPRRHQHDASTRTPVVPAGELLHE